MPQGPALAKRLGLALVLVLLPVGILAAWGLDYLLDRGFPLDDAWIHAVYGRELARSGSLAYNPGEPTTGETAPLWAVFVAVAHLVASRPEAVLLVIKGIGLALHVAVSVAILLGALGARSGSAVAYFGALVVMTNPDLLAASVAGMEVPLASLLAVLLFAAVRRGQALPVLAVAALAPLARPELALLSLVFPALVHLPDGRGAFRRTAAAAAAGTALCFALLALRNYGWSGLPLPATFYAKFGRGSLPFLDVERSGFFGVLPLLGLATHPAVLLVLLIGTCLLAAMRRSDPESRAPAAAVTGGVLYFAVSFVAAPPFDPAAFYHQRYVLPALSLILGSAPAWAAGVLAAFRPGGGAPAAAVLAVVLAVAQILAAPARLERLANDARNIDDVQVAVGRGLEGAPPDAVIWAVDAGAIRYFGRARVVDMIGLNTPEMLGASAAPFLASNPPSVLVEVPNWSGLDPESSAALRSDVFRPSTAYTVTSSPAMSVHRIIRCRPGVSGWYRIRSRVFPFSCATSVAAGASAQPDATIDSGWPASAPRVSF